LKCPLDVYLGDDESALLHQRSQPGSQISRYLDQLPAAVLTFGIREIDQVPVELYFRPIETTDFFPPQSRESRQRDVRNEIGRGSAK
jgi:hypothetical protein